MGKEGKILKQHNDGKVHLMVMLGATTEELVTLSGRLGTTTAEIGGVSADTQAIASRVVGEMHTSFGAAVSGITGAMDSLRGSIDAARGQLESTTWTGANRLTFDSAYGDFTVAMGSLEAAVSDAYQQFDGQMKQMGELIESFQLQVTGSLAEAQSSTTSMNQAVEAQRNNLETAMNTGLGVS